jgi:hypothetical protein
MKMSNRLPVDADLRKGKMTKQSRLKLQGPEPHGHQSGLVLDDYLCAVADVRRRFKITNSHFSLREMELYPGAKGAMKEIVNGTIRRNSTDIYSKAHPLLADAGENIYCDAVVTSTYAGSRIRPECREQTLRRAIEVGLQTVVLLRARHPVMASVPRRLKSLARALSKLAETADPAFSQDEVRQRIYLYFGRDEGGRERLLGEAEEMRWCAEILDAISRLRVTKSRLSSPSPQVSLAMYLVGWIEASTGSKYYRNLTTLLDAAFQADKMSTPKWVGRLAVEMNSQRSRRRKWIGTIST